MSLWLTVLICILPFIYSRIINPVGFWLLAVDCWYNMPSYRDRDISTYIYLYAYILAHRALARLKHFIFVKVKCTPGPVADGLSILYIMLIFVHVCPCTDTVRFSYNYCYFIVILNQGYA